MSEAPWWASGGLCSNRLDEFPMTGTADALNRPEFHRVSLGRGQQRRAFHLTAKDRHLVTEHDHLDSHVGSIVPPQPEQLEHSGELEVEEQECHDQSFSRSLPRRKSRGGGWDSRHPQRDQRVRGRSASALPKLRSSPVDHSPAQRANVRVSVRVWCGCGAHHPWTRHEGPISASRTAMTWTFFGANDGGAADGIRTRDPHLGKVIWHNSATSHFTDSSMFYWAFDLP
jgi:hypothetical protein